MREILFRGKFGYEWKYGYLSVALGLVIKEHYTDGESNIWHISPETVGQYTGLTDKNGKKIFEGDICRDGLGMLFAVEWDEKNARFIGFTIENERRIIYVARESRVEIVGNIHDNPELLEE